jgi:hypothetical protein
MKRLILQQPTVSTKRPTIPVQSAMTSEKLSSNSTPISPDLYLPSFQTPDPELDPFELTIISDNFHPLYFLYFLFNYIIFLDFDLFFPFFLLFLFCSIIFPE